jgi:hypothetical protein
VEQQTSVIRRLERIRKPVKKYSPMDFRSAFVLTAIDDDPNVDFSIS